MKVTMIGASGFVGTRLLGLLKESEKEYQLKNVDLLPSHFFNDLTVIGDVREQKQMDEQLKGADVVVLLAAQHRDDVACDGKEWCETHRVFLLRRCLWIEQEKSKRGASQRPVQSLWKIEMAGRAGFARVA